MANQDQINEAAGTAHWLAYNDAILNGQTPAEAWQAAEATRSAVNHTVLIEAKSDAQPQPIESYLPGWRQLARQVRDRLQHQARPPQ